MFASPPHPLGPCHHRHRRFAITYLPLDPSLKFAHALTKLFTQTKNATSKNDNYLDRQGFDPPHPPRSLLFSCRSRSLNCHHMRLRGPKR
ncbi:Myb-like domain-containing protein [Psidium guajava]|nr:Myb-like domain-containing protein [Psidium guajava]